MVKNPDFVLMQTARQANLILQLNINYGVNLRNAYSALRLSREKPLVRFSDNIKTICYAAGSINSWAKEAKTLGRESFSEEEIDNLLQLVEFIANLLDEQINNFGILENPMKGITKAGLLKSKETSQNIRVSFIDLKEEMKNGQY